MHHLALLTIVSPLKGSLRTNHQTSALIADLLMGKEKNEPDRVSQCILENSRQPCLDKRPRGPLDEDAPRSRPLKV
jgi:hypothetical protein